MSILVYNLFCILNERILQKMEHWSIDDYKNFTNNKTKKTKYRANKTSIDGHTFDSQK